jgi:TPR repeat protein
MDTKRVKNGIVGLSTMQKLVLIILALVGLLSTVPAFADVANQGGPIGFDGVSTNDPFFITTQSKAASGDAQSQYQLGFWYLCVSQNRPAEYALAIKWMKMAAAQSNAPAEFTLGTLSTNKVDAAKWYQKAAEQGFGPAESLWGQCYLRGEGIEHDDHKAFEWLQKAAQQGDSVAWARLGELFQNGQGTPKDLVQAYKWYSVANMNGHGDTEALKNRDGIAANMTANQIAEAQRQAAAVVPTKDDSHS